MTGQAEAFAAVNNICNDLNLLLIQSGRNGPLKIVQVFVFAGDNGLGNGLTGNQSAVGHIYLHSDRDIAVRCNICTAAVVQPEAGDHISVLAVGCIRRNGCKRQRIGGVTLERQFVVSAVAFILCVVDAGTFQIHTAPKNKFVFSYYERSCGHDNGAVCRDAVDTRDTDFFPIIVISVDDQSAICFVSVFVANVHRFTQSQSCMIQSMAGFIHQVDLVQLHIRCDNGDRVPIGLCGVIRVDGPGGGQIKWDLVFPAVIAVGDAHISKSAGNGVGGAVYHGLGKVLSIRSAKARNPIITVPLVHGSIKIVVRSPGVITGILITYANFLPVVNRAGATIHAVTGLDSTQTVVCYNLMPVYFRLNRDIEGLFCPVFQNITGFVDPIHASHNGVIFLASINSHIFRFCIEPNTAIAPKFPADRILIVYSYCLAHIVVLLFSEEMNIKPDVLTHDGIVIVKRPIVNAGTNAVAIHIGVVTEMTGPCFTQINDQIWLQSAAFLIVGDADTISIINDCLESQPLGGGRCRAPKTLAVRGKKCVGVMHIGVISDKAKGGGTCAEITITAAAKHSFSVHRYLCGGNRVPDAFQSYIIDWFHEQHVTLGQVSYRTDSQFA